MRKVYTVAELEDGCAIACGSVRITTTGEEITFGGHINPEYVDDSGFFWREYIEFDTGLSVILPVLPD